MPTIDKIVRSKRKTIALVIQPDGKLIVRAPLSVSKRRIEEAVHQQQDWIEHKQKEIKARLAQNPPKQFTDGEIFLYLGQQIPLQLTRQANEQPPTLRFDGKTFLMSAALQSYGAQAFQEWYRLQAKRVLAERAAHFSKQTGYLYKKVRITSAKTRWGSYSNTGTVSFPWRLVMAPLENIDYVVVHELVHSKHPDHSKAFWAAVARVMPDYQIRRRWFKENGRRLTLE